MFSLFVGFPMVNLMRRKTRERLRYKEALQEIARIAGRPRSGWDGRDFEDFMARVDNIKGRADRALKEFE